MFVANRLLGICVIGVGPSNIHSFFKEAKSEQVLCLSRFWLDDTLGRNCESRTLAIILRHLQRHQTTVKAIIAYSDPPSGPHRLYLSCYGIFVSGPEHCNAPI